MPPKLSLLATAVVAAVVGVACNPHDEVTQIASLTAASGVLALPVAPSTLTFSAGSLPGGQKVTALAARQLSGARDDWSAYVEFEPGARAVAEYVLPAEARAGALSLRTNYRGPTAREMRWVFEAFDFQTASWTTVGDNAFAGDWVWTEATFPLDARFVGAGGEVRVRYGTDSRADASQLDELVLITSAPEETSPAAAAPPAPAATTPPIPAPVPPPVAPAPVPPAATTRWQPRPGTSWQIQLQGSLDTTVVAGAYDVDLFDTSAATIAALRAAGRKVICYFSAGSFEDWRSDAGQFPAAALGNALDGWPGERWLDTRAAGVRAVMRARMDLAVSKKCDAVDPDNVDGYTNGPGFPLTAATQLDYNKFLAAEAHARGLSVGLKNDLSQVASLVDDFDFAINEQCQVYRECDMLAPFIARSKAVFGIEYTGSSSTVCAAANGANFDTNMKQLDLGAWRVACR
jgi:hypothetical protein